MKDIYILILSLFITCNSISIAQTIWDGATITVSKEAFADFTQPENQDFLTSNVILARGDSQGLFNIAAESSYNSPGPAGTEWAIGSTADGINNLTFLSWQGIQANGPLSILGQDLVLHLIDDDIYLNFKHVTWGTGQGNGVPGGGQYSYERSTETLSTDVFNLNNSIKLFPNPVKNFIHLSNINSEVSYIIYNILGKEISNGLITSNQQIDIRNLSKGLYFLKLKDGITIKFLKQD